MRRIAAFLFAALIGLPAMADDETVLLPLDQATPEAHRRKLTSQIDLWRPIIDKAGIQAE